MGSPLNDLMRFLRDFLFTFWSIIRSPRSFERNFLGKQPKRNTGDNTPAVQEAHFFLVFSLFIFSIFLLNVDKINFNLFGGSSSRMFDYFSKSIENALINFSPLGSASTILPTVVMVLIFALILSKIYFLRSKELFLKNYKWITYMFSFQALVLCFAVSFTMLLDYFLNLFVSEWSGTHLEDIFIYILYASVGFAILWPLVVILLNGHLLNRWRLRIRKLRSQEILIADKREAVRTFFRTRHFFSVILFPILFSVVVYVLVQINEHKENKPLSLNDAPFDLKLVASGDSTHTYDTTLNLNLRFIWKYQIAYLQKDDEFFLAPNKYMHEKAKLKISAWSDKNEEVMTLKPGEVYWIHMTGSKVSPTDIFSDQQPNVLFCNDYYQSADLRDAIDKFTFTFSGTPGALQTLKDKALLGTLTGKTAF